jgi:hypothetical protein
VICRLDSVCPKAATVLHHLDKDFQNRTIDPLAKSVKQKQIFT